MSESRAVILLSGGLDSATVLAIARSQRRECHTLAFDYGQRHHHELSAAEAVAAALGAASHRRLRLDLGSIGGSALTTDTAVPKDRTAGEMAHGVPITYVPARNLVFLSMATALAEVLGAAEIYIGVSAVDYSGYPDCRPEFIASFAGTARLATRIGVEGQAPEVRAPLLNLSKAETIRLGTQLGVDYALTHSCYDPVTVSNEVRACGHCDSCGLRRDGFAAARVVDPTRYA